MPVPSSAVPRTGRLIAQRRLKEIEAAEREGAPRGAEVTAEKAEFTAVAGCQWRINLWLLPARAADHCRGHGGCQGHGRSRWTVVALPSPSRDDRQRRLPHPPGASIGGGSSHRATPRDRLDWYEQSVKAVSDVVAAARKPLDWIEEELKQAYDAAAEAARKTGVEASETSLRVLDLAEERLAKAEQRLLGWVKAPEYVAWKRAICIWVGLLAGLEISVIGDMGMLHMIGVPCPRFLDMLVTGLVVGAGPGPMHSVIGTLQAGKDALDKVAELAQGRALREASASLRERTRM